MNQIPLVDLAISYKRTKKKIDRAIAKILLKTNFIMGEEIKEFEEAFAKFADTKFAIAVSSGTDAIHLALLSLGIKSGDEVIIPSHTFTATAEPIVWTNARPVFVDIDPKTFTMDVSGIERAITKKTKAILVVHLYGHPAEIEKIIAIGKKHKIQVIEDCAQAHGARINDKIVGSLGVLGCFSFFPAKNLGAYGDGGMVVTNDENIAKQIKLLRNHGRTEKYTHLVVGYGDRLDTLQASILLAKLPYLHKWNSQRRLVAKTYTKLLSKIYEINVPQEFPDRVSVYHLYVIRTQKRDELKTFLKSKGIETGIHYPIPLHLQPAYSYLGYKKGDFLQSEIVSREILSLPMYPELTKRQISYICKCIKEFFSS